MVNVLINIETLISAILFQQVWRSWTSCLYSGPHPPTQEEVKKWQLVEVKASCATSTSTNAKLSMNTN